MYKLRLNSKTYEITVLIVRSINHRICNKLCVIMTQKSTINYTVEGRCYYTNNTPSCLRARNSHIHTLTRTYRLIFYNFLSL